MEDKVDRMCSPTKSTILISTVMLLLCFGQFFLIEFVLNEQIARVDNLERMKAQRDKNTADIENIKSMLNAQVTRMNDFYEQINKYPIFDLKRKKRANIPDEEQIAADLAELKRYILKIIQELGDLQLEKEIPGPRGPPASVDSKTFDSSSSGISSQRTS
ncbi:hypothetical protein AC249_AIPGENE15885 [Exaiptasia diaphana]|nr:hypothetical protein AC249_AIPGENE15885 [Exaiptasia diaphana]